MRAPRAAMFALVISFALLPWTPGSTADLGKIQPGDAAYTTLGGCTLNFVFDGPGGGTYIGIAAHCVEDVGDAVRTSQYGAFGDVAWIGDEDDEELDFAFIKVRAEFESVIDASLRGYPGYPTGHTIPSDTTVGDLIQISGYGTGYGLHYQTQTRRVATHVSDSETLHRVVGPIHWGDSGGPLVHIESGKAYGIVSRIVIPCTCTEIGPTVQGIISIASAAGFPVSLRTV